MEYSPSRTAQGYERTHDLTTRMGSSLTYGESGAAWSAAFDCLDRATSVSLEEFSSHRVAQLALQTILNREPDAREIQVGAQSYTGDWSRGIQYPSGMLDVLGQLSDRFTLSIVSPHPAMFETALGALGASPADALCVGDTYLADYVGPESLGIRAFLIDPDSKAQVPGSRRIDSLFSLIGRLKDLGLI